MQHLDPTTVMYTIEKKFPNIVNGRLAGSPWEMKQESYECIICELCLCEVLNEV